MLCEYTRSTWIVSAELDGEDLTMQQPNRLHRTALILTGTICTLSTKDVCGERTILHVPFLFPLGYHTEFGSLGSRPHRLPR